MQQLVLSVVVGRLIRLSSAAIVRRNRSAAQGRVFFLRLALARLLGGGHFRGLRAAVRSGLCRGLVDLALLDEAPRRFVVLLRAAVAALALDLGFVRVSHDGLVLFLVGLDLLIG